MYSDIFYHAVSHNRDLLYVVYFSPFGFYIFILSLCFQEISIHFQQCRVRNSSSFTSIHPLNFLFQKRRSFLLSVFIFIFLSLPLFDSFLFSHLFTYLPRQGNLSCKHTSSKNSGVDHTRISPIRRKYTFSQRKHDIRANKILFFFTSFTSALAVLCVWL